MNLRFDLRHYWNKVYYDQFYTLNQEGTLTDSNYDGFHDRVFNQFNIDMTYRWRFAPGSDIFVVWENSISVDESDPTKNHENLKYGRGGVKTLGDLAQNNSLSVRLVYYLDYNQLTK